jgi:hypothetical protein
VKKVIASLMTSLVLVGTVTAVHAADIPDEQFSVMTGYQDKASDITGIQLLGLSIEDNTNLSERVSNMVGRDPEISGELGMRICKSADDKFCKPGLGMYLYAILPPCKDDVELNCISGLVAIKDGVEIKGEYKKNFPSHGYTDFPSDVSKNIPEGSTPSIWSFSGLNHSGGTSDYLATFGVNAYFNSSGDVSINSYNATINPVSIKSGKFGRNQVLDGSGKSLPSCTGHCGMELRSWSQDDKFVCASLDEGYCALRESFPSGVRFRLSARLSQSPTGWLHGRMKSPDIEIKSLDRGVNISIEAEPVTVPVVGILKEKSKLPEAILSKYENVGGFSWSRSAYNPNTANKLLMISPDSQEAFDALQAWKDLIMDRASASPTAWAVRTLNTGDSLPKCLINSSQLVGVVTTNSMVYLGSPPTFDRESQSLDYKVASPHFTSKGDVFKGSYDLQIKSDVARCLYGFSNAPISAKISIVSESGEPSVATTVVNEKNGWLKMAAYGFTFSSPTVKVKLTQEAAATATPKEEPSPEPSVSASKPKRTTILCSKGKTTKKVTGIKPQCPAGYKKK